jgi:heme/copper-type cytochrome/quinol oxidase subunit 2
MARRLQVIATGAATVAAAVLLAACSSGPGHANTTTTTEAPTTTSAPTTTTTEAPTTTSAPTTTTSPTTKCQLAGLHIAHTGSEGAAGTEENTFSIANVSSTTCTIYGYPGMALLDASGNMLPTNVVRGGGTGATDMAPSTVTLPPGSTAYFNVTSSDVTTATTTCSSGAQVEVTPPTNTTHVTLSVAIDACDNGKLDVSPVFGSTDTAATQTTAPSA